MTGKAREPDGSEDTWTAEKARTAWADLLSKVQYGARHITITRSGKRAALLVPPEWYDRAAAALAAHDARPTKRA
jgi:prevent-host-death family protein